MNDKLFTAARISRRDLLKGASVVAAGLFLGCAKNPVTGKSQLMLVSEEEEIQMDRQYAPQQLSADFGTLQDRSLNAYINQVGQAMAAKTHRPHMPYAFHGVNATYVNAYAFPGGTIACTRGILLAIENEAELAALLGHELGHVNARHTAEILSKQKLTAAVVGGAAAIVASQGARYGDMAAQLGMLGSGALLAAYSRDNERQADSLGMRYMVAGGYSAEGMVGLMEMLNSMSQHKQSVTELLFATHPMSRERYQTALKEADEQYGTLQNLPLHRERFMDHTARLRRDRKVVDQIQLGEAALGQKKPDQAADHFQKALNKNPEDYTALILLGQSQLILKKLGAADRNAQKAMAVYPDEAQSYFLGGFIRLQQKQFESALEYFTTFDQKLGGNPNTLFFKGYCHEGLGRQKEAAEYYYNFLKVVQKGENAQYAYRRLVQWGYIKP